MRLYDTPRNGQSQAMSIDAFRYVATKKRIED
jgi:hypothetical protein